ncbi:MAG: hypothetical protein R3F54_27770 [Alphaproteobacteria bacterium]
MREGGFGCPFFWEPADLGWVMLDSAVVWAHACVTAARKGQVIKLLAALLLRPEGEPVFKGIQASSWPTCFACVDGVQLMYVRFGWQEPLFTKFERHRGITQTFVALMPRRFVMVVAPPAADWPDKRSAPSIPPGAAVIIGDGIACSRPFPSEREALDCLMLTSAGVQA